MNNLFTEYEMSSNLFEPFKAQELEDFNQNPFKVNIAFLSKIFYYFMVQIKTLLIITYQM